MDIIVQKLCHMRDSLGAEGKSYDGNYLPMLVDRRILEHGKKYASLSADLVEFSFVLLPVKNTNDVLVFDKELYVSLRKSECTDTTIVDIYENFINDLSHVDTMDEILCLV